jgi:peptidoglycan/LPS O-acetylase OafA/YrhL
LYLTHLPVVALCYFGLRELRLSPALMALALLASSVPASLLVAYLFYLGVERFFVKPPAALFRRSASAQPGDNQL